jgi:hypothetical protein
MKNNLRRRLEEPSSGRYTALSAVAKLVGALNRTIPMHRDIELRDQALRLRGERSAVRNTK